MERNDAIQQLSDIHNLMNRSSRFLSLSGLSGILAGCYSIAGAFAARFIFNKAGMVYFSMRDKNFVLLMAIAGGVIVLSILTAFLLSARQAKSSGEAIWNSTSKRLVINFIIPMFFGGIFCFMLIQTGHFSILAPATLLVYGLSLLHISKYTLETIRILAYSFLLLALISMQFLQHNLLFWTIGFGGLHILYGSLFYILPKRIK